MPPIKLKRAPSMGLAPVGTGTRYAISHLDPADAHAINFAINTLGVPAMNHKYASHWLRRIEVGDRPAYLLIADLIAEDVRNGRLTARDRLPTLRELADQLHLNYTTVARAYAEARKRGLIDSRPGIGTHIRGRTPSVLLRGGSGVEMVMNMPPEPSDRVLLDRMQASAAELMARADLYDLLRYQDFGGTPEDREAAVRWLAHRLPSCSESRVLVCPGIHSVLVALISQLARPGELICVESLTYPGIKAIANQLGVQLHALTLDEEGPSAAEFELACKSLKPKALYCNPTLLNPTTTIISRVRREALADIALRYSIPIIEDDAYSMLASGAPAPLATLAPELTYYVTGFSKCLGAGLRSAFVMAPNERAAQRLAGSLRSTTVMASPFTNALTTQWLNDGTAMSMLQSILAESAARQDLAARHLAGYVGPTQPEGFHLWLPLVSDWSVVEFASLLRTQGVGVVASAAFSTDGDPPPAVRICLGGPMSRGECEEALRLIADTLNHPQHPHATVM